MSEPVVEEVVSRRFVDGSLVRLVLSDPRKTGMRPGLVFRYRDPDGREWSKVMLLSEDPR